MTRRLWWVWIGFALTAACALKDEEYAAIDAWLQCDECVDGERGLVDSIGPDAVPTIARALRGPSEGRRTIMRRKLEAHYQQFGTTALTRDQYVNHFMGNYVATYQKRAAISLGDLEGRKAREALETALDSAEQRGYRPDVVGVIAGVLAGFEKRPFAGSISRRAVTFNDTVTVRQGTGLAWNGDEWVILHATPYGDSLVIGPVTDSLKFVAVGEVGTYSLAVTGLGPQADTQVTPIGIVSVRYATHSRATAPVVPTALTQLPVTRYLALGAQPGDTADHFRLEPSALLSVTAMAESPGLDAPTVRWYLCASVALATWGPSSRLSGVVVDERRAPVAGARLSVVGTALAALTGGLGEFSLTSIPPSATAGGLVDVQVSKLGYVSRIHRVQSGDSVRIHLVSSGAREESARSQRGSRAEIPGGECRILQVAVRSGGVRIVRLRFTSP